MAPQWAIDAGCVRGNSGFLGPTQGTDAPAAAPRRFGMVLSVAVHAAVLLWLLRATPIPAGIELPRESLAVQIVSGGLAEVAEEVATQREPQRATEEQAVPREPEPPKPKNHPIVRQAAPKHQRVTPSSGLVPGVVASGDLAGSKDEPQDGPSPLPTAPPSPGPSRASDDAFRIYSETVSAWISKHKPGGIRFRGTVTLAFSLSRDGRLAAAEIANSSGMGAVDQAALGALRAAAPFPPPPENASEQQLTFAIPFQFR